MSGDIEVNVHVTADGVESLDAVAQGEQAVGAAGESAAGSAGRNWGMFGTTLGRVSVLGVVAMDRLSIAQTAVENAQIRAELAQQRYTDAVARWGPTSEQAIRANKELEISTKGVEIAQQREQVRTLIMAGVVIPQMIRGVYNLIPALGAWDAAQKTVTIGTIALTNAQRALLATSIIGIPALLLGLAAAGAFGGGGGGGGSTINHYGDVNLQGVQTPAQFATSYSSQQRVG